ncbi:MAG: OmpH family outer membrane protein [Phycisphaerae bacterium]|nr:OmpH family outer membrane protein [Phycisphaerae bacterium]
MKGGTNILLVMAAMAVVSIAAATMSGAQPRSNAAGGTRVAAVDLVKVFNDFEQTKAVNDAMKAYRDKVAQEADQKMAEIKAEEDALEKTDPASPDRQARITKIKRMRLEYSVWESLEKDFVSEQYVAWVKRTYQMVIDGIAEVAKKQGVQLVVTQEQVDTSVTKPEPLLQQILNRKVVYADNSVDISAEVLATLNANFAKLGGPASVHFGK